MILDRVTITGADDAVDPSELWRLSKEFGFVEWGILLSESKIGNPRYPSLSWIRELKELSRKKKLALSLHVCGSWTRELLLGRVLIPHWILQDSTFDRIQLNFNDRTSCDPHSFFQALIALGPRQFIFQIGDDGDAHLESIFKLGRSPTRIDAVPLFDCSGGKGILPDKWPSPRFFGESWQILYHGYAGGLGPETLPHQLPHIAAAAIDPRSRQPARVWLDMEGRVRNDSDSLDLQKVRQCLEICAPAVRRAAIYPSRIEQKGIIT